MRHSQVDAAHLLYANGWTVYEIANVMGISVTLCKMYLGKWKREVEA